MHKTQYLIYGEIHLMNLIPVLEYKKRNSGISSAVGPLRQPRFLEAASEQSEEGISTQAHSHAVRMVFL